MLIIPAIDLKDGLVVRFVQGKFSKKVYSTNPLKVARHWEKQGAKFLHIVDLDGAFTGSIKNLNLVKRIVKAISIPVQFGGGVRSLKTINDLLSIGVKRVVLGTKAVEDESFLKKAFERFKEKVVVAVDAKKGKVMVKGWAESYKNTDILKFSSALKRTGFKEMIYTDTLKDGTLKGPNIKGIKKILKITKLNIVVSGGVSKLKDLINLKKLEKEGVTAVIIGKALYEGRFTLPQALKFS
ncbi:MAG: 1-(5-phosphoribosyl)-5-[(5-phosphoribosylamino)methylideneamino]imidazole-4-carboxamide isomerase [Candidatus Omnitrophica bacterium]|nr:1-(5-phosphoribosyl)-5-[(5-phosphoribosylamino)methylideneamino]imidazole-4-carboxamide isomerase [Candidatus Omnitrophota bacterium]